MGDFERKIPASASRKKKLHAAQMEQKKFLHWRKKEKKNDTKLFHHSDSFTKFQRTCNHSSLVPF